MMMGIGEIFKQFPGIFLEFQVLLPDFGNFMQFQLLGTLIDII